MWHKYRAYVEIQALQFSLLGGRIFFKGLHYHGQNETIIINDGYLTWRYWLRRVKEVDCAQRAPAAGGPDPGKEYEERNGAGEGPQGGSNALGKLPCRVVMKSRGLQWFIYNRTPAYDDILKSMSSGGINGQISDDELGKLRTGLDKTDTVPVGPRQAPSSTTNTDDKSIDKSKDDINERMSDSMNPGYADHVPSSESQKQARTLPSVLSILPVKIECSKGAVVLGNLNTRSVLVARFETVSGHIDACGSRSLDQYKQCINLDFNHPVIQLKPNRDFKEAQLATGVSVKINETQELVSQKRWLMFRVCRQQLHKAWSYLRNLTLYRRSSIESTLQDHSKRRPKTPIDAAGIPGQHRWLGLTRYLDDDEGTVEQERWKAIEYGEVSTVVDSPKIAVSVYWDVPGLVLSSHDSSHSTLPDSTSDINGDVPPDWGIELRIGGGTISYGPWADRQRTDLQNVFFPTLYRNAIPTERLKLGQSRVNTVFKFVVEIEKETSLQIPTREESKDWKWKDHAKNTNRPETKKKGKTGYVRKKKGQKAIPAPDVRPFGWLDIKVLRDSTISLTMDLVASSNGYKSRVDLDLRGPEMSSSVNHGLLWRTETQLISCDLSYPLGWNALRQWQINIESSGVELFLLRDHIFLLTDLINDWASGPPGDFHTFVPFDYVINLRFSDFELYVNANDSNIIDNPSDIDDNTFVVIWGKRLNAQINIPLKNFRPVQNRIRFDVRASSGGFELRTPPWNTQHTFLDNVNVAALEDLMLDGSYNYFTSTSPTLTDIVLVNIHGVSPEIHLYGFLVRYLMKVKDNYFGEDLHFRTLEEYQSQVTHQLDHESVVSSPPSRLSNDLDVILSITAENARALLPVHLYSVTENLRLDISSIVGDLRFTNYYMDLAVSFSPVAISRKAPIEHVLSVAGSSTQVFIDGFEIFGHRLFGLPPTEPTYVCNWDFSVGSVTGECPVDFLRSLILILRSFTHTFGDGENALPPLRPPVIHDVTFLRARLCPISVWIRFGQNALLLSTSEIKFDFNDWAGPLFSERTYLFVPSLSVIMVDTGKISDDRSSVQYFATTHAFFETTVLLRIVKRKSESKKDRLLQQSHISVHDARTHRTSWLIHDVDPTNPMGLSGRQTRVRSPAMSFPPMPETVLDGNGVRIDSASISSSSTRTMSSRKSSFLAKVSRRQVNARRRPNVLVTDLRGADTRSTNKYVRSTVSPSYQLAFRKSQFPSTDKPIPQPPNSNSRGNYSNTRSSPVNFTSAFSSPYKKPNFPLHQRSIHISDVPVLPDDLPSDRVIDDASLYERIEPQLSAQDVEQSSFIVHFNQGLRALCTPEALIQVPSLMDQLQPRDTVSLLDSLQIDAIADVLDLDNKRSNQRSITEARIFIPYLYARFLNDTTPKSIAPAQQEQLDFTIDNFTATARATKDSPVYKDKTVDQQSLHVILDRISCSAKMHIEDLSGSQGLIHLTVDDPVLWISKGACAFANIRFQDMDISTTGKSIDHISSLTHLAANLSDGPLRRLSKATTEYASRTRTLILSLTTAWDSVPDPPFLTRASYVLRSTTGHLRMSDSWKMVSRLRYVHQSLPDQSKARIVKDCSKAPYPSLETARNSVIASFEHWRAWDIAHVKQSLLIRKVFGDMNKSAPEHIQTRALWRISIKSGGIQVLVDPGPNQNQIAIDRLTIDLAMNEPKNAVIDTSHERVSAPISFMVQMHCARGVVSMNWDVCKLLEDALQRFQVPKRTPPKQAHNDSLVKAIDEGHSIHFTAFSDAAIITLNSINLEAMTVCEDFKISLDMINTSDSPKGLTGSLLANAATASLEVRSHSRDLSHFELRRPSIFCSKSGRLEDQNGIYKMATSCNELSFKVLEHPLGLLEIADLLLQDEVVYVKELARSLQPVNNKKYSSDLPPQHIKLGNFHVALLLHSYSVSFAMLPSLTYELAGQGVRSSMKSGIRQQSTILFDFDIKDHAHIFTSQTSSASEEISTMHMPPTNGRLILDLGPLQKSVIFHSMVEGIVLDASAVHALLAIVNRPEVSSFTTSIRREFELIWDHYKELFPSNVPPLDNQGSTLYSAYITWAGLAVHASTPGSDASPGGAQLRLNLGCLQLKATNRDSNCGKAITFPEFELRVRGMDMHLTRPDDHVLRPCGDVSMVAMLECTSEEGETGKLIRAYRVQSTSLEINLYAETVSAVIEVLTHLQDRLKSIDLSKEVKSLGRYRRGTLRSDTSDPAIIGNDAVSSFLSSAVYSVEMAAIQVCWKMEGSALKSPGREVEDLVLSFTKIDLATRRDNAARLFMQDFQLQMVPSSSSKGGRTLNSALLPEVVFKVAYLSTTKDRRLAFQAAGKSLDIRLTPQFILPAAALRRSIAIAVNDFRAATKITKAAPLTQTESQTQKLFSHKKLASVLIDADFAGAVVYIQGQNDSDSIPSALSALRGCRPPQHGRYGQFIHEDASSSATLRAPGIALKVEYKDTGVDKPTLNAEFKIDASSNILYPTVVPLVIEISSSVKEVVGEPGSQEQPPEPKMSPPKFLGEERLRTADPSALLGNCRLNLGLRICRQEFTLSCQPIARVAATTHFDEIYVTVNTVQSADYGQFFTLSAAFTHLQTSVQHDYSRESTASFDVDYIVLSLMNSRHVSAANGISAILRISPMKALVNAKQLQDFLLFREIWIPPEIRRSPDPSVPTPSSEPQAFIVERYQQVAAAGAFPWNATVSIAKLDVQLDLGQSLGKSKFTISNFWVSSKKASDWEQNLCLGFEKIGMESKGRMSGFITLQNFRVRTSIQWPIMQQAQKKTPLIQASLGFDHLRIKAAFDFQAFLVADITSLNFLMYNVRDTHQARGDRLVGTVDGDKVQIFCITTSASQGLALYQAVQRLFQEKQAAYETSLRDIEKYMRRKSSVRLSAMQAIAKQKAEESQTPAQAPLQLQTDVVVMLKAVNVGAFPSTFFDNQIFKLEALDASARFAVKLDRGQIYSNLGMTLGQLRIALSNITRSSVPRTPGEVSVEDVVACATGSRGGTVLKVPKLVATMQTWQSPESTHIDYIFKSSFQGKVDVGWNYSRIGFLRGMLSNHNRALAQRLGKPLPQSALQITGGPQPEGEGDDGRRKHEDTGQEKITAVVNVPQSKYEYTALQPAIIETPQLRDMGEATPPLEWIGLHRDRLPNLTHQIVIVTLLEVAKEVEDAYSKILGSA